MEMRARKYIESLGLVADQLVELDNHTVSFTVVGEQFSVRKAVQRYFPLHSFNSIGNIKRLVYQTAQGSIVLIQQGDETTIQLVDGDRTLIQDLPGSMLQALARSTQTDVPSCWSPADRMKVVQVLRKQDVTYL